MREDLTNEEEAMRREAQQTIADFQAYEHEQLLDTKRKIYNGAVVFIVFLLILFFQPHLWQMLFFFVLDHNREPKPKKDEFVSLYDRWGK